MTETMAKYEARRQTLTIRDLNENEVHYMACIQHQIERLSRAGFRVEDLFIVLPDDTEVTELFGLRVVKADTNGAYVAVNALA